MESTSGSGTRKNSFFHWAGAEGIEPPTDVLETPVIPLNYAPKIPSKNSPPLGELTLHPRKLSGGF